MRHNLPSVFLLFLLTAVSAQKKSALTWPLVSPRVVTGNYGELRPAHFHAGLDLSTSGKTGQEVYAANDGYVSRLKVSPYGYGKAIYLTHPGGKVSVYAHLQTFSIRENAQVKKAQYEKKSFDVDIYLKPNQIMVRRGEIIGLSGNSGGSSGPHLHFEIRDEKSETPLNPLTSGDFFIPDKIPPTLQQVAFYDLSDTLEPKLLKTCKLLQASADSFYLENKFVAFYQSQIGFGFAGFDLQQQKGNNNQIHKARLYCDGKLIYSHEMDRIDFADNRYVNEFSEQIGSLRFQKCFLPTLFPAKMYTGYSDKGRITFHDSSFHAMRFVVTDERGNTSKLNFNLAIFSDGLLPDYHKKQGSVTNCLHDYSAILERISVKIPAKTLYHSVIIKAANALELSGGFTVQPAEAALSAAAVIGFEVPERWKTYAARLTLKDASQYYPPKIKGDSVFYSVKNFGAFQIETDLIPPEVKMKPFLRKAETDQVDFIIADRQSGIGKYELLLNGNWVVADYDPKNDLLAYLFDENTPEGTLQFKLSVEDRVGNKTITDFVIKR
jgi:hypothetical protein